MLPNTPPMLEAHFGVPMSGAVLNTLNSRLDAEAIAFMLDHGEAKVLLTDREFSPIIGRALALMSRPRPLVIDVDDPMHEGGTLLGEFDYEAFLQTGDEDYEWVLPSDEWNAISLDYTSGTTGNPKGVVTHHRGAYLNAVSNVVTWEMPRHSVYLWTLPMFHCNGWCFPWTMALQAGVSVCLRKIEPALIFSLIREHRITHMCGAPIVYGMLINAPQALRAGISHPIAGLIAGAAPPAAIIEGCERIGIDITHVYGLTEVYGPAAVCARQAGWDQLPIGERAALNAPGRCLSDAADHHRAGPGNHAAGSRRRGNDGRDFLSRQSGDEGLPEKIRKPPMKPLPAAGFAPATWRCCTRTARSRSKTAART